MASVCFSYPGQKNMLTWSSIHKNNCLRQDQFTVILIYINLVISEENIFSNTIFYYGTTLLWYYVMVLLIFMHILNPTWKPSNKNSHPRLLFKLRQNTSTCCLSNILAIIYYTSLEMSTEEISFSKERKKIYRWLPKAYQGFSQTSRMKSFATVVNC